MPAHRTYATAARIGVLAVLWVALSGKIDPVHLGFGAFSVALTAWMTRDLRVADTLTARHRPLGRLSLGPALRYPFWLLKEIAVANVQIARLILDPRLPVDPVVVRFDSRLEGLLAHALLANSITLTPGTFTIDIRDGIFTVHALDAAGASATALGAMRGRVAAVFGEDVTATVPLLDVRRGDEVRTA
jgi:multicomponent Na+:H+ antiporter subunit E